MEDDGAIPGIPGTPVFGTLESAGKIEIGKHHGRVTVHRSKRLCNAGDCY